METTDNTGCREVCLRILALIMCAMVFGNIVLGFTVDVWVGVAFTGVVVITHIVVELIARKKEQAKVESGESREDEEIENEEIENEEMEEMNDIPEEYYNQVTKAAEDLYADYERVVKLPDLADMIDSLETTLQTYDSDLLQYVDKVSILFWTDLTRCYIGLGHAIDLNSKEGLGYLYFIARTKGWSGNHPYSELATLRENYQSDAESILEDIKQYIDASSAIPEVFVISRLLASNDADLQRKFLVDMYRFASITSKADNTVTDQEAEWLSNIMRLQEQNAPVVVPEPAEQNPTELLDELIGLDAVKQEVETLSNFIRIQQARAANGLKTSPVSYHCVFTGSPGTGKTTVARILAQIYKSLGVVSKGHLVETDRAGLVAEFIGQTAIKTDKVIESALDGVLFIDEAYALAAGGDNDYGKEAIATLLKRMEDYRERLIVILAGYTENMKDFIASNPGLQSRFSRYIDFPDYTAAELLQIFELNMRKY
ncbi:MAG: AAA family ATPase, partial [Paludibacteraceae bacterium]|nr:AAA family ATPase [Paludibacteraceae bacterium]